MLSGGIRTSTIATSGLCARTFRSRSSASPAWPTTSKPASSSSRAAPSRRSTASSAITTRMGSPPCTTVPAPTGLLTLSLPSTRGHPVGDAAEPRAEQVGAAAAVVAHHDTEHAVLAGRATSTELASE